MTRILFTGYAPVHYLCFRPLHAALSRLPDVEVHVSGGLRTRAEHHTWRYDVDALYGPFGVPPHTRLTVDELRERDVDVLVSANTNAIAPRSAGMVVEIFHGVSFRNLAIRAENAGKDAYHVVGPYMHRGLERMGVLAPGDRRGVPVGFPKTDRLLDGSIDREAVLAREGLSGERPVVLYAPTGARDNSLETMGEEVLRRLKAAAAFDVLVKLHDHPKRPIDWRARLAPLEDEHLRIARGLDVVEQLFAADLLLTDASSVANEFTLLDRPIVFLDVPDLLEAAARKGSVDLQTWGRRGGELVATPDAVVGAVDAALAHPERRSPVRRAIAADLFYNAGHATDAAREWLVRHAVLQPA
jgi:CDP-Glycerol:Poly(glycerophosphate) glycerophosphotransferase